MRNKQHALYKTKLQTNLTNTTNTKNGKRRSHNQQQLKKNEYNISHLSETGIEGYELEIIPRSQIDAEQGIISVVGVKRHDNGTYKLKEKTAELLRQYLAKHPEEYPSPKSRTQGKHGCKAEKQQQQNYDNPEINKIPLKNLRNYAGAIFYLTMGKDPIQTMHFMRHKKLERTMDYLRGLTEFTANAEYISKIATTAEEAIELLNQGFKKQDTFGEKHIYTKLKT